MLGGTDRMSSDSTVDGLSHDEPPFNSLAVPNSVEQESSSEVVVDPPPSPEYQPAPEVFSSFSNDRDPESPAINDIQISTPVSSVPVSPVPSITEVFQTPATPQELVQDSVEKLSAIAQQNGLRFDVATLSEFVKNSSIQFQTSGPTLRVHDKAWSWKQHYTALSFLLNGQLHADYTKLSGWLGLPSCGKSQWQRIIERLEPHVTQLAEWSCKHIREKIEQRGDRDKWVASFDGFYLTRGHYSNNSSATIHDFYGGGVAWFTHRTKTGAGHNWVGTSGRAEADMLEEVLTNVKEAGFVVKELVTDKDSTTNAIYCKHFPEGTVTYCSNHCTKNLHKQLEKLKKNKCDSPG